jgi:Zn-dependent protease
MGSFSSNTIAELGIWYLVFVFSTTCHEAAHAWAAHRGGDPTAYAGGHVSLDPLPHIRRSPGGMVVIPILSFLFYGWMLGWASVPLNPEWARRYPGRSSLMALAGPTANLLLAVAAFGIIQALFAAQVLVPNFQTESVFDLLAVPGGDTRSPLGAIARALSILLMLNVLLGLFNLIPMPPLDGAAVLEGASPRLAGGLYARLREVPMASILGLLVAWRLFDYVSTPVMRFMVRLMFG